MTIEEIEQTLQTVAENQARFSSDIGALREQTEKLTRAGAVRGLRNQSFQVMREEKTQSGRDRRKAKPASFCTPKCTPKPVDERAITRK